MGNGRDTAVRIDLQEPRGFDLVVYLPYVCVSDGHEGGFVAGNCIDGFEFFEDDGGLNAVGGGKAVKMDGHG